VSPFQLHLVGSGGRQFEVPPELDNVVVFHSDLDYTQFFDTLARMDICVPAFVRDSTYYEYQASATIGLCLELNVRFDSFR